MMTKNMERLGFPNEAIVSLEEAHKRMLAEPKAQERIKVAKNLLLDGAEKDFLIPLEDLARMSGVDRRTSDMVFLLLCMESLKERYADHRLPEALFWDTMADLRYKLMECYQVEGVWGTFVTGWYRNFFRMERFCLGRLQYEKKPFQYEEGKFYRSLVRAGDLVLHTHIPSSGPLLYEDVMDSLRRAYDFYREDLREGKMAVDCSSWLLYPPYFGTVFARDSNLYRFARLFDVIQTKEDPNCADFWRVFGCSYSPQTLATVPENTSLRRCMKAYLQSGGHMGIGYGVLLFDGERIV